MISPDETLLKRLAAFHVEVRPGIVNDSAYIFRLVADLLLEDQNKHQDIRTAACEWLEPRTTLQNLIAPESWSAYVARVRKADAWGDYLSLMAICNVYKVPIIVLSDSGFGPSQSLVLEVLPPTPPAAAAPTASAKPSCIWLGHYAECYFVGLCPDSMNRLLVDDNWQRKWADASQGETSY